MAPRGKGSGKTGGGNHRKSRGRILGIIPWPRRGHDSPSETASDTGEVKAPEEAPQPAADAVSGQAASNGGTAAEIPPVQEVKPAVPVPAVAVPAVAVPAVAVPAVAVQAAAVPAVTIPAPAVAVPVTIPAPQDPVPAPVAPAGPSPLPNSFYLHTHSTGAPAAAIVHQQNNKMAGLKYGIMGGGAVAGILGTIWVAYQWITKKREGKKAPAPRNRPWYRRIYRGEEEDARTRW